MTNTEQELVAEVAGGSSIKGSKDHCAWHVTALFKYVCHPNFTKFSEMPSIVLKFDILKKCLSLGTNES